MRELKYKCKRLAADSKKHEVIAKQYKDENNQNHCISDTVLKEIVDDNEKLKSSNLQQEFCRREFISLKRSKEDVVCSITELCQKLKSDEDSAQCVRVISLGCNTEMLKTLAEAISSNIRVKAKNAYSDHIVLLIIELQNLGMSQLNS